jgi:predicted amidohydrolase
VSHEPPALTLGVAQLAPVLREPAANAGRIAAAAADAATDLLLTPELSLTGYDLGDSVHRFARAVRPGAPHGIEELEHAPGTVIVGLVEAGGDGPFNAAVALQAGRIVHRHRKLYLPTYGMFDEGRWFGRGRTLDAWQPAPGWSAGLLVCEDFWHPGLAYVLASRGIDLLLVQAAAPGRGAWQGGDSGIFASADVWERIVRTTAQLYGIYVALCNRVGVEGGVTFAGGSVIAGPDGEVVCRADDGAETTLTAELSRAELRRARQPYAHRRDDDAALVMRELGRGLRGGTVDPAAAP